MKSVQQMETVQSKQAFREGKRAGRTALALGLFFGVGSGIIDTIYAFVVIHKHFSLDGGTHLYLYPEGANAPYFNVLWTFLYNIPIYILLCVVFFLVGFLATSLTRILAKHVPATIWTGWSFLVVHSLFATFLVFSEEIYGQLGSASTPQVAQGVLFPALLYSVIALLILTVLGLGLSRLGGLYARTLFSRGETMVEPH